MWCFIAGLLVGIFLTLFFIGFFRGSGMSEPHPIEHYTPEQRTMRMLAISTMRADG